MLIEISADARPGSYIEECLVSGLVELWDNLRDVPHFLFVNRDRSHMYLGIGRATLSDPTPTPYFIANQFTDNEKCEKIYPKILLSTSACIWPKMKIQLFQQDGDMMEIVYLLKSMSWIARDACHLLPPCEAFAETGMTKEEYHEAVTACIAEMQTSDLSKVVLSRRTSFTMKTGLNPYALLLTVMKQTSQTDQGKRYVVVYSQPGEGTFVSLTPERFCSVSKNELETEALAGTCKGSEFEMTDKLAEEHGLVGKFVSDKLRSLRKDGEVTTTSREFLKLRDMTHCRQKYKVRSDICSGSALMDWAVHHLHPTPAVGGLPTDIALNLIAKFEKFYRKFFASPMGFFDPKTQTGELCVALRSAWILDNKVNLFAGAGLVRDSDPSQEWEEMELKMAQFRQVLLGSTRPVFSLSQSIKNATHAQSMIVIEELIRQNVTKFIVCPGSRSTPLTVAVRENSVAHARSVVVHDERCAGFYAVGVARAGGLAAIIVTSGTAVANLLPAVCEAREANLAIILLTADRPSRSWNVGEFQTVPQNGIFSQYVGFQKNLVAPLSEAPKAFATHSLVSVLADVSFAVGDVAKQSHHVVHLNFEFEKSELQPDILNEDFSSIFCANLNPRICGYSRRLKPYTRYIRPGVQVAFPSSVARLVYTGRCVIVVGELRDPREGTGIKKFCEQYCIPCIAEVTSLIHSCSEYILLSSDQLLGDETILSKLSNTTDTVIRMGGPLISGRLQDWSSSRPRVIRVIDDSFSPFRHDPQYAAEFYFRSTIVDFLEEWEKGIVQLRKQKSVEKESEIIDRTHVVSKLARYAPYLYKQAIREITAAIPWNEAVIAFALSTVVAELNAAVFLSASMPCRDYAIFGGLSTDNQASHRLVAANRGANGIDGVISAATGYAAETGVTTYVLIGDVATLHDLSGLSLALNVQPGSDDIQKADVRIVCVNNAGGAIFSFLPIHKHTEVFTPFFDTPHKINFTHVANGMLENSAVCVTDVVGFEAALRDPRSNFIECTGLPDHETNVELHKRIGSRVSTLLHPHLE